MHGSTLIIRIQSWIFRIQFCLVHLLVIHGVDFAFVLPIYMFFVRLSKAIWALYLLYNSNVMIHRNL